LREDFRVLSKQDQERNEAAYRRMKDEIARTYPHGWFVGIFDERIVGAAATFHELEDSLRTQRLDPRTVLIVEAGVDYPDYITILGFRL
jgi:hypothetical protein